MQSINQKKIIKKKRKKEKYEDPRREVNTNQIQREDYIWKNWKK